MKLLYTGTGYFLGFLAIYIAGAATSNLWIALPPIIGRSHTFIYHMQWVLLYIPAFLLFGLGIFCLSKGLLQPEKKTTSST
ncbi:MAG TPA: hypothetical protein VGT05_01345 [Patescibacteria group bacterium]|nr:hypothetical protein [Patescibacteria group bacterium]